MTTILVTGGAGYIGSHVCKALQAHGYLPVTYDNLVNGHRDFVKWGPFEHGDVRDDIRLADVMRRHSPQAVIHLAGLAYPADSMKAPDVYYMNNVVGSLGVLNAMRGRGMWGLVFSSSCSVYGEKGADPITETALPSPISAYGASKLVVEMMIRDFEAAGLLGRGFGILRFFNAAGADPDGEVGERHDPEPHLIPNVISSVLQGKAVQIFGNDYPTPDGTCMRDYVHVSDLADAHVAALNNLQSGSGSFSLNLGSKHGYSVLGVVQAVGRLTGASPVIEWRPRRIGDPSHAVADSTAALARLGWRPRHESLEAMLKTAIAWHHKELARQ